MSEEKKFHNDSVVLDIHDRPTIGHWVGLSLQHLFTMFFLAAARALCAKMDFSHITFATEGFCSKK